MEYIRIANWNKWQSYRSDRGQPPWIKLHRTLLRHPCWQSLDDSQKGQLVSLWLLAADRCGEIPADPVMIKKLCMMTEEPDLQMFISLEFIDGDASVTPVRRQDDASVTPQRQRQRQSQRKNEEEDKIKSGKPDNGPSKKSIIKEKSATVLEHLNNITGRSFKQTKDIEACLKREGCSVDDCKAVIDCKAKEWVGTEMERHLNATTPFRPSHFSVYLDEANAGPMNAEARGPKGPKDEYGRPVPDWKIRMDADFQKMEEK